MRKTVSWIERIKHFMYLAQMILQLNYFKTFKEDYPTLQKVL